MNVLPKNLLSFKKAVREYYKESCRDLSWRISARRKATRNEAYKILVSEFMLQQTQVSRVSPHFERFIKLFPTLEALARAKQKDVLLAWKGLGYNRRALNLKRTIEIIYNDYKGVIPKDIDILDSFPGVGSYTARAISTFIYNEPNVFIETNIRTLFLHYFFANQEQVYDKDILVLIEKTLDAKNPRTWYYALMDYGSFLKKTIGNLNTQSKHYSKQSKFEGSRRQARSRVLHLIAEKKSVPFLKLDEVVGDAYDTQSILNELIKEGFIKKHGQNYSVV